MSSVCEQTLGRRLTRHAVDSECRPAIWDSFLRRHTSTDLGDHLHPCTYGPCREETEPCRFDEDKPGCLPCLRGNVRCSYQDKCLLEHLASSNVGLSRGFLRRFHGAFHGEHADARSRVTESADIVASLFRVAESAASDSDSEAYRDVFNIAIILSVLSKRLSAAEAMLFDTALVVSGVTEKQSRSADDGMQRLRSMFQNRPYLMEFWVEPESSPYGTPPELL